MTDNDKFIKGLIVKAPHERAPDFVKARISIKREELIGWLQARGEEWINLDVKESKGGKLYAEVSQWKPKAKEETPQAKTDDFVDDDPNQMGGGEIPF